MSTNDAMAFEGITCFSSTLSHILIPENLVRSCSADGASYLNKTRWKDVISGRTRM